MQNTVDLTKLLLELRQEGYPVTKEVVARLSPYLTGHLRRYGDYAVNVDEKPEPIDPRFDLPD